MLISALVSLAAGACAGPGSQYHTPGFEQPNSGHRMLATMASFPAAEADDVHRPGFNGRVWVGRVFQNDHGTWPLGWRSPGPRAYGAHEHDFARVYARVGHVVVGFSPWEAQNNERLEAARTEWLKEQGYVGGVRTFVNDASLAHAMSLGQAEEPAPTRVIQPRAIFELAPDVPRFRSRMHVDAGAIRGALDRAGVEESKAHTKVMPAAPIVASAQ